VAGPGRGGACNQWEISISLGASVWGLGTWLGGHVCVSQATSGNPFIEIRASALRDLVSAFGARQSPSPPDLMKGDSGGQELGALLRGTHRVGTRVGTSSCLPGPQQAGPCAVPAGTPDPQRGAQIISLGKPPYLSPQPCTLSPGEGVSQRVEAPNIAASFYFPAFILLE
jgi:hypothetical protein